MIKLILLLSIDWCHLHSLFLGVEGKDLPFAGLVPNVASDSVINHDPKLLRFVVYSRKLNVRENLVGSHCLRDFIVPSNGQIVRFAFVFREHKVHQLIPFLFGWENSRPNNHLVDSPDSGASIREVRREGECFPIVKPTRGNIHFGKADLRLLGGCKLLFLKGAVNLHLRQLFACVVTLPNGGHRQYAGEYQDPFVFNRAGFGLSRLHCGLTLCCVLNVAGLHYSLGRGRCNGWRWQVFGACLWLSSIALTIAFCVYFTHSVTGGAL